MKKKTTAVTVALMFMLLAGFCLGAGAQEWTDSPGTYSGYLFSKLGNVGTKSEGREYYLQQWDGSEIHVLKKGFLWQSDPELDTYLDTKVTITGMMEDWGLRYTDVKPFKY